MLEEIMSVAVTRTPRYRPAWMRDEALRSARTCYDHLAGRLGVALTESLVARQYVLLDEDGGAVTEKGAQFFAELGLELPGIGKRRRFCRPCVDWSERRPHLGGAVGAALAQHCFSAGWIERIKDSRAVAITASGRAGFLAKFKCDSAFPKMHDFHPEHPRCKTRKCGRYRRREYEVIKAFDIHRIDPFPSGSKRTKS